MLINQLLSGVTATGSLTSQAFQLCDLEDYSIQIVVSGTDVAGTFTLECSNTGANYVTVSGSSQAITLSDSVFYDVRSATYRWVRIAYTHTSGTGTITATLVCKEQSRIA